MSKKVLGLRMVLVAFALAVFSVIGYGPAAASNCVIDVAGITVCGELVEPLPTITIKPDPIIIPGPTVTIKPPTVTIRPPGTTVTLPAPPPETVTVTEEAEPAPVGPSALPAETETEPNEIVTETTTETVSPSETGQTPEADGTIEPGEVDDPAIDFGDDDITVIEAGIGLLTLLALVGLLLLAMYSGYVLGYKDKEKKDTRFMRALLDSVKSK